MTSKVTYTDTCVESNGQFLLMEDINAASCKKLTEFVFKHNITRNLNKLYIFINSYGGETAAAFSMVDIIQSSVIPVTTFGLGSIQSSGLTVFLAGENRIVTPNTVIMSHQYFGFNVGKHHELMAAVKSNNQQHDMCVKWYMERTGMSREEVETKMLSPSEHYFSAEEALGLNIATAISYP